MPPFPSGALLATLLSRRWLGPSLLDVVFAMKTPSRLAFQAGQFVSMIVGRDPSGTTLKRSYSIASSSQAGERLRFLVRIIPNGLASTFLTALELGAEVAMTGPHGFFVLNDEHAGDVVFGATGTGAAALMPMLDDLALRSSSEKRVCFWGARHEEDLFARAEIDELCSRARTDLRICLTAPPLSWPTPAQRIGAPLLAGLPGWKKPTFYLVGNGAMIAEVKRALIDRGIDRKSSIRTEAFFD